MVCEVAEEQKQEPKRHSRPRRRVRWSDRSPVDEIAPQHEEIHSDLLQWGRWNYTRREKASLASAESLYTKYGTPPSTAPATTDLRSMEIERAVLRMPKMYRDTLRFIYVQQVTPHTVCRVFTIRYEAYPAWTFTARCMVVNLLRRSA